MLRKCLPLLALTIAVGHVDAQAQESSLVGYEVSAYANASTGSFAPYMIGSWRHGKSAQKGSALLDMSVDKSMDKTKRFSWGFDAEVITGYTTYNDYAYWSQERQAWGLRAEGPSAIWIQQLYGELKYRCLQLSVGAKEHGSALLNNLLSSGDLVESGNARPIPEVRLGLVDFVDLPLTQGWVQVHVECSWGKMPDNDYLRQHYNFYNYHILFDAHYSYRHCFFRTNPSKPFSVTVGMQAASFFGGTSYTYYHGELQRQEHAKGGIESFFKIILPMGENGNSFYEGSTMGTWDLRMRYRLPNASQLFAYFQGPWEDGSGIGRMNKLDGLWGIEYRSAQSGWLTGAVLEYIDFRDQSGPIHWAPGDFPGTSLTPGADGRDDYYNNFFYNSYANYGMAIGTPFLMSPIYNLNGYPAFVCNRAQGFHAGVMGELNADLGYRVLCGYQRGMGTYNYPYYKPRTCTSVMLEATWNARPILKGMTLRGQCALDGGSLRGNNFGTAITISYSGNF